MCILPSLHLLSKVYLFQTIDCRIAINSLQVNVQETQILQVAFEGFLFQGAA